MSVRRADHMVIRPDGSYALEPAAAPTDADELGDQFEELLEQGDEPETTEEPGRPMSDPGKPTSAPPTFARGPDRDRAAETSRTARARDPQRPGGGDRLEELLQERIGREVPQRLGTQAAGLPVRGLPKPVRSEQSSSTSARERDERSGSAQPWAAQHQAGAKGRSGEKHKDDQGSGGQGGSDASEAMAALMGAAAPRFEASAPAPQGAPEPAGARLIAEASKEVAARISTIHAHGSSQIRIDLRDEVLPQTSMTVEDQGGTIVVTLASDSEESAAVLASHAQELGQAISRRTGRPTRISFGDQSWQADGGGGASSGAGLPDEQA